MNHDPGVTHADHAAHQHHVLAELCLLALPVRRERVVAHHDGRVYTVGGWRWPLLTWPLNRAGLGSGWARWHPVHLARLCLLPLTLRQRCDARISAALSDATYEHAALHHDRLVVRIGDTTVYSEPLRRRPNRPQNPV